MSLKPWAERFAREAEDRLGDRLLSLTLYGSVARGTEHAGSDVDLLAVVETEDDAEVLWDLAGEFLKEGIVISIIPETPADVRKQMANGSRFIEDVAREGEVLSGEQPREAAA